MAQSYVFLLTQAIRWRRAYRRRRIIEVAIMSTASPLLLGRYGIAAGFRFDANDPESPL